MAGKTIQSAKLDLPLSPEAKEKLQVAAIAVERSVSEFVLESALVRAEQTLSDRTRFDLDADQWTTFLKSLDVRLCVPPRLKRLLQEPSVFERGEAR